MTEQAEQGQALAGPLDAVNHQTLDELFSRDPMSLADADLETIVLNLRRMRSAWAVQEAEAQAKPKRQAKVKATPAELAEIEKQLGL